MPRTARKLSSTGIYHVVIKGANRQIIFEEVKDYQKYLSFLDHYRSECDFEIYAYCLMSNHVHILLQVKSVPLHIIFHRINTSYATWFNLKYNRTGYLQQGRYHSEPVENLKYLYTVVRYIHQNPLKAGLEAFPGESYPWSSIYAYKSEANEFISTAYVTKLFGGYDKFMKFNFFDANTDKCLDLHTIRRRLPDDVAKEIIEEECNIKNFHEILNFSIPERNKILINLYKKGISARQLNRLTGIPLGVVNKLLKGRIL